MTRQEAIERLNGLPTKFIESKKIYSLDIIQRKVQLQYDSFLKGLYKEERVADDSANPEFIYFQIGPWRITMETEED